MAKEQNHPGSALNVLTHGTKIVGTITTDKDIRIDGELEGDIVCTGKIVVGHKGLIKGTIQCDNAEIIGTIDGKINVNDILKLSSTARITGEIKTKTLSIEPNAVFNGTCEMTSAAATPNKK